MLLVQINGLLCDLPKHVYNAFTYTPILHPHPNPTTTLVLFPALSNHYSASKLNLFNYFMNHLCPS